MAVVALNKFRSIRVGITTENVGIYTCPIGVASIIILSQVTNVSSGAALSTYNVTAYHSRSSETPSDYAFAKDFSIPPNDGANLVSDGRLALETSDVIKISSNENGVLELILSVLETAKQ
jgi:hypothetical protein